MADGGSGELLSHILGKLEIIETSISQVKVDIASMKAEGVAETVKDLIRRVTDLEIKSATWSGAAGTGAAVGRWVAGIAAALITGAVGGVVGWMLHR